MAYIGKSPVLGNFIKLDAITTSSTATYTMNYGGSPYSPQSVNHMLVSLNGVIQAPSDAYTVSGSTITFSSTLSASDVIDFIMVYGNVLDIGTPSDSTVGFSKITSNLITGATAETSIAGGDSILIYDDSATALRKMTRTNFVAGIGGANTPAFYAYNSTATSLTSGSFVKVDYQTEILDSDNCFASSRFTPTTAGYYFLSCQVRLGTYNTNHAIAIYKNGSSYTEFWDITLNLNGFGGCCMVYANGTTDYFEVYYYQASGSARNTTASQTVTYFSGFKLIGA